MAVLPFKRPAPAPEPKEPEEPHLQGEARCAVCNHTWTAVAPVGSDPVALDCPSCRSLRGFFTRFVQYNRPMFTCQKCTGVFWNICQGDDGYPIVCCITCGASRHGIDLFPEAP